MTEIIDLEDVSEEVDDLDDDSIYDQDDNNNHRDAESQADSMLDV